MRLWYDRPAEYWHEALPVGNGRLGGMVFGKAGQEVIKINEDSIWSGKHLDRNNPDAAEYLPKVRRLIREEKLEEAQRLAMYALSGTPNSQRAYQPAGECYLNFWHSGETAEYMRWLELDTGVAGVRYAADGITFRRETFASAPAGCLLTKLWTEEGVSFSFDCLLGRNHNCTDEVEGRGEDTVLFHVDAPEGGISFCMALHVRTVGGSVKRIGEHLIAEDVKEAYLYLDVETSFRRKDETGSCLACVKAAAGREWEALREEHIQDFGNLFGRLLLHFSGTDENLDQFPTDKRLAAVQQGAEDMGLIELYFQYGRYLLISSSRPGSLPANLQGVWNDQMQPAWDSKYTININTEMNYWIAGNGGLAECQLPLFDLLERVKENGKETARRMYGCRGSVAHHNTDLYGDSAPQDHCITSTFWVMGEAWLATHIWEQYLYTGDKAFLEKHFDVLDQCVTFFRDYLVELPDKTLATSPSMSPENTYLLPDGSKGVLCEGAVMDTEILMELFRDYLDACRVLEKDIENQKAAKEMLERLPVLKIGKHGQLMEWMEDYEEWEPGHRHISHLYAVYPGSSITWDQTPELMRAAKTSLERRLANGGGHTGWSRAWIIGLWTHFKEGAKAYENLKAILSMGTYPNLMDNHPLGENAYVFQIDGNLGASAAILEMLAYSRPDRLELLPAITKETSGGSVKGLGLRSGGTLSMEWEDGKVRKMEILPERDAVLSLCVNGEERKIHLNAGEVYRRSWES